MKDVYIKNPQMGDPTSVDPRLTEIAVNIEKLQSEVQKFEVGSHMQTEYLPNPRDLPHREHGNSQLYSHLICGLVPTVQMASHCKGLHCVDLPVPGNESL